MTKFSDAEITQILPPYLADRADVRALSKTLQWVIQDVLDRIEEARTWCNIDGAREDVLDLMAAERRVPLYQDDFTLESKRELIKEALPLYAHMGTPGAVNRMLSAVFPGSYVEEWYEYGGKPYFFQIVLETSAAREPMDPDAIIQAVDKAKRLTSHLDGIIYQCNIGLIIGTHGRGYKYRSGWTGRHESGTMPRRSRHGRSEHGELEVASCGHGYLYEADLAGTKPWRNQAGGQAAGGVEVGTDAGGYAYASAFSGRGESGTAYGRSTAGAAQGSGVGILPEGAGFRYSSTFSGRHESGTEPQRSYEGGSLDGGFAAAAEGQGYPYRAAMCGRGYCRERRSTLC